MELYLVVISCSAAIVAGTWRLASILNDVRGEVRDMSRRLSRVERACGLVERDDDTHPRITTLAEVP